MSETPTLPVSDEINNLTEQYAGRNETNRYQSGGEFQVPRYPELETFDLSSDEILNDNLWSPEELSAPAEVAERIIEAQHPKTRAQEVEESLFYLSDTQLLAYAIANTKAVWALKHLA